MAKGGTAKDLVTLWQTKVDNMLSGEMLTEELEKLVKAAKVGNKKAIKFLGFKNHSRSGKPILNILAEPADPYKGKDGEKEKPAPSW
jgi:hypothetical protein